MELKDLLGEAYHDGMTVDEISAALSSRTFVDPSTLGDTVSKNVFDKTASDLARVKKELKDLKAAGQTDAERLQAAIAEAEAQKREFTLKVNRLAVEKVLVGAGLEEADYSSFIDGIVGEDAENSVKIATNISAVLKAQRTAAEAAAKKQLQQSTKTPPPDGGTTFTLESFRKLSPTERLQFSSEHPDEYRALYNNGG